MMWRNKSCIEKKIKAPVNKGDKVGTFKLISKGKVVVESPLVANDSVKTATWWELYKRSFGMLAKMKD